VDLLARLAAEQSFAVGEWIMRLGDPADRLHLVRSGRAAIEIATPGRDPLVVSTVTARGVIGWSWLLPPHRVQFDVVALDPTTTLAVDATALRHACEADHELGYRITVHLAHILASRLEATRLQLVDVYGNPG
jgi:CRP/FNR family cyclic AMP-dependent transcriptional regulator